MLLGCYVLVRILNDLIIIQHTFLHNRFNQTVLTFQWKWNCSRYFSFFSFSALFCKIFREMKLNQCVSCFSSANVFKCICCTTRTKLNGIINMYFESFLPVTRKCIALSSHDFLVNLTKNIIFVVSFLKYGVSQCAANYVIHKEWTWDCRK